MHRFFAPDIEETLMLPEVESQHAVRVLRLKEGDEVEVVDGKGVLYRCRISLAHSKKCGVEIVERIASGSHWGSEIVLCVAPTKNLDRIEWLAEKCTEMGVDRVIPVKCRYSERKELKTERLQKILVSAMKQSLKATLPQLDELTPVMDVIKMPFEGQKFICYCDDIVERKNFMKEYKPNEPVLVLVGPEGDFSREEVDAALSNGFVAVTLGDSRLRTETAAVAACFACHTIKQIQ
jgi:16S rRNA (uracil1498-N3)-methyltransferase